MYTTKELINKFPTILKEQISNKGLLKIKSNKIEELQKKDLQIILRYYHFKKLYTNKNELIRKLQQLLFYFKNEKFIIRIQSAFKRYSFWVNVFLRGPALYSREICVNNEDFLDFEEICKISKNNFISFKDNKNFVYGYHIKSLFKLLNETDNFINPYNRKKFPVYVKDNIRELIFREGIRNKKYSKKSTSFWKIRKDWLLITKHCKSMNYPIKKEWFLHLNTVDLLHLYRKLYIIWNIRSNLSTETKNKITSSKQIFTQPYSEIKNKYIRQQITNYIKILISYSDDKDMQTIGIIFFLYSLSSVSKLCYDKYYWIDL